MATRARRLPVAEPLVFVLSIAAALVLWEIVSRTGTIAQKDLPAMSTSFRELWSLMQTGAFWPLLVQTMYGVRDVDPIALDTARSFGVGRLERLYRIKLPSSIPYIATGLRISSTVSLILAFTAELFMGTSGLGQKVNFVESFGLNDQLYAYALATGFLGVVIHLVSTAAERRALRWHPSQRIGAA